MKLSEDQYELIEAYLDNELSPADRLSFETEFRADKTLWAEVERQVEIRLGLRGIGIARSIAQARQQHKQLAEPVAAKPAGNVKQPFLTTSRPLSNWMAVAASVVVVLTIGYYVFRSSTTSQADIAMATMSAPAATSELIKSFPAESVPKNTRTQFLDALTKYEAGRYDQVITQLKTLPVEKKTVHYKNYFLGLSYLADKQAAQSIPLLKQATSTTSAALRQKAEWFLALAYVKDTQPDKARPLLKRISADETNPFRRTAQQVLRKIE